MKSSFFGLFALVIWLKEVSKPALVGLFALEIWLKEASAFVTRLTLNCAAF
jgi:hypothetical protein